MIVENQDKVGGWAKKMTFKVRLVPPGAGLNFTRAWKSFSAATPLYTKKYTRDFTVPTDWMRSDASWHLQMKYVWDRPAPLKDVVREFTSSGAMVCTNMMGG